MQGLASRRAFHSVGAPSPLQFVAASADDYGPSGMDFGFPGVDPVVGDIVVVLGAFYAPGNLPMLTPNGPSSDWMQPIGIDSAGSAASTLLREWAGRVVNANGSGNTEATLTWLNTSNPGSARMLLFRGKQALEYSASDWKVSTQTTGDSPEQPNLVGTPVEHNHLRLAWLGVAGSPAMSVSGSGWALINTMTGQPGINESIHVAAYSSGGDYTAPEGSISRPTFTWSGSLSDGCSLIEISLDDES